MNSSTLRETSVRTLLFGILLAGLTMPTARAENVDMLLGGLFDRGPNYIGHTSVERTEIPETSAVERKFLIVDFRFDQEPGRDMLQAKVHTICMALLQNRDLMQRLTRKGYDMVSVAFDRQSQYDCL